MSKTFRSSSLVGCVIGLWCVRIFIASVFDSVLATSFLLLADLSNFAISLKAIAVLEIERAKPIYADQPASFVYLLPVTAGMYVIFDLRMLVSYI